MLKTINGMISVIEGFKKSGASESMTTIVISAILEDCFTKEQCKIIAEDLLKRYS